MDLYQTWLQHVFNRQQADWYFKLDDVEVDVCDEQKAELIKLTLLRSGTDLLAFDNRQVYDGLNFIFNNICSDTVFCLKSDRVPRGLRAEAIRAITYLYADCFEKRVDPVLSHRNEGSNNPLNQICYMFWDITPIAWWGDTNEEDYFTQVVLDVLEFGLRLGNIACLESVLHGLGHVYDPKIRGRVVGMIDRFLQANRQLHRELLSYAKSARRGCVL